MGENGEPVNRSTPHVLRLPGRALGAPAHIERDRVSVPNGQAAPARDQGRGLADEGSLDDLQAPRHCTGPVATARRRSPPTACSPSVAFVDGVHRQTSAASREREPDSTARSAPHRRSLRVRPPVRILPKIPDPVRSRQRSRRFGRILFARSQIHVLTRGCDRTKISHLSPLLMGSDSAPYERLASGPKNKGPNSQQKCD
jgi:hypothetical protein